MATSRHARAAVAVLALSLAAALPSSRLFADGVLGPVLVAVFGALGVAALSRRLNVPPVADLFVTFIALAELVALSYLRPTLSFGFIPTAETWRGFEELVTLGLRRIQSEVAPIDGGPEVFVFVTIGAWVTAWLIDTSARMLGTPMLAIASGLPMLAVPGTLVVSDRLWLSVGPFVAASILLLWASEAIEMRPPRLRKVAWTGLLAGVITFLVVPVVPGFGARPLLKELGESAIAFNPITALRPTLEDRQEKQLFTVRTTQPSYYRLTALDEFDGEAFRQSAKSRSERVDGEAAVLVPRAPSNVPVTITQQSIQLSNLAGSWLPAHYEAANVTLSRLAGIKYEPDTGALVVLPSVPRALEYVVTSRVPRPTARLLDELPGGPPASLPDANRFLELPRVSGELRAIADEIVGKADTPYRKAVAIQKHLRTFAYDLDVAATHDIRSLEQFLTEVKRGYCEQFATAMAVLARIEGIPSRVVVGFGSGNVLSNVGGESIYRVTTLDAHAWPELWLEGVGWIAFEPTPRGGFGIVPQYTRGSASGTIEPPVVEPSSSPEPSASPTTSTRPTPSTRPSRAPSTERFSLPSWIVPAGSVAAGTALLAVAFLLVWRRALRRPLAGVPAGYRVFLAACEGLGFGRRRAETPREHADRLAMLSGIDAAPIRALAAETDGILYGGAPERDLLAEGMAARDEVLAVVPRFRRLVAKIRANLSAATRV